MPSNPRVILGISFGHGDSSASLCVDGVLIAAAEEERFSRIKHDAAFPLKAIAYCLSQAGLNPEAVNIVAVPRKKIRSSWAKMKFTISNPTALLSQPKKSGGTSLKEGIALAGLTNATTRFVEHHVAHLYSALYLTEEDSVAMLSLDGLGDFVSCMAGVKEGGRLKVLERVYFPNSLGFFYTGMTQFLGFPYFGDEFKVMGLSSFGKPNFMKPLSLLIRSKEDFGFSLNLEAFPLTQLLKGFSIEANQPMVSSLYNKNFLIQAFGISPRKPHEPLTQSHRDLAKSVQVKFEEIANILLQQLYTKVSTKSLALAGGCSHNSVWVGKIPTSTPFQNVFVAPACHDAGLAIGACAALLPTKMKTQGHPALLGPVPSAKNSPDISKAGIEKRIFVSEKELIDFVVYQLNQGKVIGLCQDRMEFGPRALGSRSIIADPRDSQMKDRLNARVKHREPFRPFAASVQVEYQKDWFENTFFAPTMEAVFDVAKEKQKLIPAVTHVDGTCRIQSVAKNSQPFYWKLIEAFRRKTGVPMLLNTSFNDAEPIVCDEGDAINCFLRTDLDILVTDSAAYLKSNEQRLSA